MSDPADQHTVNSPYKSVFLIAVVLVLMFGFGYLLVPIYDLVCDITGLNGRSENLEQATEYSQADYVVDEDRWVTVVFEAEVGGALPWKFTPVQREMRVHPGELNKAFYVAANQGAATITGQAVPQVSPPRAAPYFEKTDCFCFTEQELKAGESKEMPVVFVVSNDLPEHVDRVRLSYTFFIQNENLALVDN